MIPTNSFGSTTTLKRLAHCDKCICDSYAYVYGNVAFKDACKHDYAMFGKGVGSVSNAHLCVLFQIGSRILRPPIFTIQDHKLCPICGTTVIGSRNLRPPILQFLFCQLKHETGGETSNISFHLLVQALRRHTIEFREVAVKHDLYAANRENPRTYGVRACRFWLTGDDHTWGRCRHIDLLPCYFFPRSFYCDSRARSVQNTLARASCEE